MLDNVDRRMLALLQAEGRITNQELAERVGLSPTPCLRRLRRLEEAGVITGYRAVLDEKACGLPLTVFMSVRLTQQNEEPIEEFETAVRAWPECQDAWLITGSRDYLLRVVTEGLEAYERFLKLKVAKLKCVASIESTFAMSAVKRAAVLPLT